MHAVGGSICVPDQMLVGPYFVPRRQVDDAAWVEIPEWRDDIVSGNGRRAVWAAGREGLSRGEPGHQHGGGYELQNGDSHVTLLDRKNVGEWSPAQNAMIAHPPGTRNPECYLILGPIPFGAGL
jgi:hypothetical protein